MQRILRLFIIFFYFLLTLFINNGEVLACADFEQNTSQQYYISLTKNETGLVNKKEEYYAVLRSQNRLEITNPTNKNSNYGSWNFNNPNNKFDIANSIIYESIAYPILITHSISPNLKHAIHTRAP